MRPANPLKTSWPSLALVAIVILAEGCIGRAGQPIPTKITPLVSGTPSVSATLPFGTTRAPAGIGATASIETPIPSQSQVSSPAAVYQPPQGENCLLLADHVMDIVGAQHNMMQTGNVTFHDALKNESGAGCQITIRGSTADFRNFKSVQAMVEACQSQLPDGGWKIDPSYTSVSNSTIDFGMRRDNELALFSIQWQAEPGSPDCPPSQTLDQCQLNPRQVQLTILVNYAVHS